MPRQPRIEPSGEVVARVASFALALPEAYEEDAWKGVRWRIRKRTFAHVIGLVEPGGDVPMLTFRSSGDELLALTHAGQPFYQPPWSPTVVGMALDADTDWDEVAELVTESYRFCAPTKLGRRLDR